MAAFPIESDDSQNTNEALNYLLSGPSGLGQNFQGFSAYAPAYLTGNYRPPFTNPTIVKYCFGEVDTDLIKVYPNATGLVVGMAVTGYGVAPGAVIASIGETVTGITLEKGMYTSYTPVTLDLVNVGEADSQLFFAPLNPAQSYVAPIPLGTSSMLTGNTWKFEFASTQPFPPFSNGQPIVISGVDNDFYDGRYDPIGVVDCTTEYVICKTTKTYDIEPPSSNGTAEFSIAYFSTPYLGGSKSTDCNGKVVVNGATDRVFLSAQLNNLISYEVLGGDPAELQYIVSLNRFVGFPTTDPINPEYRFLPQATVSEQIYTYSGLTGTGTLDSIETIFGTVIDQPLPNYYWYILEVMFYVSSGDLAITSTTFGQRSLSVQVVKQ